VALRAFGFEHINLLLNGVDRRPAPSLFPGHLHACFQLQHLLRRADALTRRRSVDEALKKRDVTATACSSTCSEFRSDCTAPRLAAGAQWTTSLLPGET